MELPQIIGKLKELQNKTQKLGDILHLSTKRMRVVALEKEIGQPNFWNDTENASKVSREFSALQEEIATFDKMERDINTLLEMSELDELHTDVNLCEDLEKQLHILEKQIKVLEFQALFDGKHDMDSAILSLHSGSGGTEAQDWAEMLLRMYMRFAENMGWKVTLLDESRGSEAGIKSATVLIQGTKAYGYLQGEHGTHRLVRISPFDAESMRHTSFAGVEVTPEIEASEEFQIDPKELRIDTFCAGGHGGQSVNTTYSAVRVVHLPTGLSAQCQNERSQQQNKEFAMKVLYSKLLKIKEEEEEREMQKIKGEYKSAEWGNQIRSYVLHPYKMVKDVRTRYESSDPEMVLNGDLLPFMESYLRFKKTGKTVEEK